MATAKSGIVSIKIDGVQYLGKGEFKYNRPDLSTIHTNWDMYSPTTGTVIGPDGQIDAEDTLTNLEA